MWRRAAVVGPYTVAMTAVTSCASALARRAALGAGAVALAVAGVAVPASALTLDPAAVPPRTQLTLRVEGGPTVATANADESRPALSLAKLYLGHWVLHHGSPGDAARVEDMIRYSQDGTATQLDAAYPQAISATAAEFGLANTHYNGFWGHTTTSTNDVTAFLNAVRYNPVDAPLIRGMETAAPVAADGYRQDYGTATLPGVTGTKFGWSDDHTINATASIGPGFSVAASTYGPPAQLTQDVQGALVPDAPAVPAAPLAPAGQPSLLDALLPPAGSSLPVAPESSQLLPQLPQLPQVPQLPRLW